MISKAEALERVKDGQILTCQDFDGSCCTSCHEDVEYGLDLMEFGPIGPGLPWMRVCCAHLDQAAELEEWLERHIIKAA